MQGDNITCDLYHMFFFKVRNLTAYAHAKFEIFQRYVNELRNWYIH